MNLIEQMLASPFFQILGWTLIHFIWQGTAVALIYAGASLLLRGRSGNLRYAAACAAMLLMIAFPVATMFLINPSRAHTDHTPAALQPTAISVEVSRATAALIGSAAVPLSHSELAAQADAPSSAQASLKQWANERLPSFMPWLVALWFAGVFLLSIRFLGGLVRTRQLKRRQTSPTVQLWQERLTSLCARLRVSRPVRLCESALVEVPTVIGWLRPVILLPATALTGLSAVQLEALLAHELAHIRRYDYLVNLIQTAVETLLFYHPAVWWISDQMRQEREHCCDDLAVATCGDVLTYARALATLEQLRSETPRLAVAASGGSLIGRIQRLVGGAPTATHRIDSWLAGVIAISIVFGLLAGTQARILPDTFALNDDQQPEASSEKASLAPQDFTPHARAASSSSAPDREAGTAQEPSEPEQPDATSQDKAPDGTAETYTPEQTATETQSADSQDFIGEMVAAGYTKLSVDQLVALKTHGVTPEFARRMNTLMGEKLSVDELVAFVIHGVTTDLVDEIKALGYTKLSADTLTALKIHGVTPAFMKGWKNLGYDHLSLDSYIAFRIHGVTSEFVAELRSLGYDRLSADQLTAMRIHGVTGAFVQQMKPLVSDSLSVDDLTAMRIHGVTPAFAKEFERLGFSKLTADDLIAMRIHGVTPQFVAAAKAKGFGDLTIDQLIQLRRLNIIRDSSKN